MSELLNQVIGGYQLLEVIGSGGVATVYRGRPVTGEGQEVAVKVIYPEFARQASIAANFAQVIRAAAQLASHPHILPVLASGEDHEYLYLVTPLVKEGSLATLIARGARMGAGDVGPFFQQLCGAVSYAHSIGLTHGNIKPSNVYLFEGRHVLLGDFGLLWDVRVLDPSWSGSDVAVFEYLAPEVFDGRLSPASDIYSLGATLFASLTGHAPFHQNRLGDLVNAARQQTPPSLAQQSPPLPGPVVALDTVVRQAMAKQVEHRYASAILVGQAIETTLRQAAAAPVGAVFGAPAQPLASEPLAPGMAGGYGAGGQGASLEAQFPQLPPMPGDMGLGAGAGVVVAQAQQMGAAARAAGEIDPPTMRVPAPSGAMTDAPTMVVAAPSASLHIPAARLADIAPIGPATETEAELFTPERAFNSRRGTTPMPPAQMPQQDQGAASGQFSATELGLPRLTNPALETDLPPDWRALLTDESARKRHDPFAASESALIPLPPIEGLDAASSAAGGMAHASVATERESHGWDASSAAWEESGLRQRWDEPGDQSGWDAPAQQLAEVGAKRGAQAGYDIDRAVAIPAPAPARRDAQVKDEIDTLHAQKVWTNSFAIVRGKRRPKAPFFTIVALLALTTLELAGIAVVRPDICVTHACSIVAKYVHHLAPGLQLPGVTAPVQISPVVPQVSVLVGGVKKASFALANSSVDPITWSATPTLSWMTVSPSKGALSGHGTVMLTVTVAPQGVAPGIYTGALAIYVGAGVSEEPVVVTVKPGAQLGVSQRALTFTRCGVPQSLTISNPGGARLSFSATASDTNALQVNPGNADVAPGGSTALAVSMICGAATGSNYAVIIVSNGGSATIGVTFN